MKQKLLILWLMLLTGAAGLRAEVAYGFLSSDHKTLTLYYDNETRLFGTKCVLYPDEEVPGWNIYSNQINYVVIDSSFANYRPTSCHRWFSEMGSLFSITGISYLNTSSVTDMSEMFYGCFFLSDLDVSGFDTSKVINMERMFHGCSRLTSLDVSGFKTNKLTNAKCMFYECEKLTDIDVSHWSLGGSTDMNKMFYGCKKLTSLDLSSFIFNSNEEYHSGLLVDCSSLETLKVPATANNLDYNACSGVGTQFHPCTLVYPDGFTPETTVTGSGWYRWKDGFFKDSGPQTYVAYNNNTLTFYYDTQRFSRTLGGGFDLNWDYETPEWSGIASSVTQVVFDSSFANARPTSCYLWFSNMVNLTSFIGLNYLNTSMVRIMTGMFYNCSNLTYLDVHSFKTANVRWMGPSNDNFTLSSVNEGILNRGMFEGCSKLATLIIGNWDTSFVKGMGHMFRGCSSLTSLYVGSFDTSKVDCMRYMFENCSSLTSLNVNNFNTEKCQAMYCMFDNCNQLTSLDLSSFTIPINHDNDIILGTTGFLNNCTNLRTLTIPVTASNLNANACTGVGTQSAPCALVKPIGFTPETTDSGSGWYKWKNGYFKDSGDMPYAVLSTDKKTLTFYYDTQRSSRTGTTYELNTGTTVPGWYSNASSVTKVVFDDSFYWTSPTSCSSWFRDMSNLTSISGLPNLNTTNVTNMAAMFANCSKLTSLDLSDFDTSNVTDMSFMFWDCFKLTTLKVHSFNTSKVTDMSYMFTDCQELQSLDLSSFTFKSGLASSGFLNGAKELTVLVIPATAGNLGSNACNGVGTETAPCTLAYPSDFTPQTTDSGNGWYKWKGGYFKDVALEPYAVLSSDGKTLIFYYDSQRTVRIGTTYDLNTGTDSPGWYSTTSPITNVVFDSSFADARPTSCNQWFHSMNNLTSIIGMEYLNTSCVTNMGGMFSSCTQLANIDVSHFNTSQVVDMSAMFERCAITNIDVSNFNTSNVTNMMGMFFEDTYLESLDISNFVIPDSTSFSPLGSSYLLLYGCTSLKTLVIPATANKIQHIACNGVGTQSAPCTLVYPAGFTPQTTASGDGWYQWKSGYFKDPGIEPYAVLNGTTLTFYYDSQRAVRTGTTYDLNTGTNSPGWSDYATSVTKVVFDPSFANARPTSCDAWFSYMNNLTSISGLNYLNTSSVTSMEFMFYDCSNLTSLDVSGFNTTNVRHMSSMFDGCSKLTNLDVSGFNTENVGEMYYMFSNCTSLTCLDVSGFDTGDVTSMTYMFYNCENLTAIDVSDWDVGRVEGMENMFYGCKKLSSLDLSSFVFLPGPGFDDLSNEIYEEMLSNCTGLKTLCVPASANYLYVNSCNGVGTQSAPCTLIYPEGFTPETTATGDGWYQWKRGYFKDAVLEPYAVLTTDTLTFYYDSQRAVRIGTTYDLNSGTNSPGWYSNRASVTNVVFDSSFSDARPTSCSRWFYDMNNLTSITGMENLNTSSVTHMNSMFSSCTLLSTIDVSHFNTSQVEDMSGMFERCAITTIDVSNFDTSNVTNMFGMFTNDASLESLDISNFVIPDSTSYYYGLSTDFMFLNCSNLKTLVVPITAKNIKHGSCTGVGTQDAPLHPHLSRRLHTGDNRHRRRLVQMEERILQGCRAGALRRA